MIDRDPGQPAGELAVSAKAIQMSEDFEEGVLHRIFPVLSVLGDLLRYAQETALMSFYQVFECRQLSRSQGVHKRCIRIVNGPTAMNMIHLHCSARRVPSFLLC